MRNTIDNTQDIIDSRDVIERLSQLESDRDDLQSAIYEATEARDAARGRVATPDEKPEDLAEQEAELQTALDAANLALAAWLDGEDGQELKILQAVDSEGRNYAADWQHGETMIRDSYFERYAQELADDLGAIPKDASWPATCIDWERAADELKMYYTSVDFDGVDYWLRRTVA